MYTDNGKIYRSQQFEYICASLGCTLLHSQPFVPQGRGKVERMFHTVRMRFLSTLEPSTIIDLDDLNQRYFKWLEDDYKRKSHKGLNVLSPYDVLMSQISKLNLVTDINRINEHFLLRITRKIQPDATTQIQNILYETDSRFSGKRVGEAKVVRFHDNAHAMRKFKGNRRKDPGADTIGNSLSPTDTEMKNSISYSEIMEGEDNV